MYVSTQSLSRLYLPIGRQCDAVALLRRPGACTVHIHNPEEVGAQISPEHTKNLISESGKFVAEGNWMACGQKLEHDWIQFLTIKNEKKLPKMDKIIN